MEYLSRYVTLAPAQILESPLLPGMVLQEWLSRGRCQHQGVSWGDFAAFILENHSYASRLVIVGKKRDCQSDEVEIRHCQLIATCKAARVW